MDLGDVLTCLAAPGAGGYHYRSPRATEPVALAIVALVAHGHEAAARPLVDWLTELQAPDGRVGIDAAQPDPGWPIGWAVLAWHAAQHSNLASARHARAIDRAVAWILRTEGTRIEYIDHRGHDTTIIGWPWVEKTHSWVEPTAISVLALKRTGHDGHPRTREGVRLLINRLLSGGGCNYGNTIVFGQELRPHVQPTGLCLAALAGEHDAAGRVAKSIDYLRRELPTVTATASLCYGLLGLAAHDELPAEADQWLAAAKARTLARDASSYKLALVALAAMGTSSPIIPPSMALTESESP